MKKVIRMKKKKPVPVKPLEMEMPRKMQSFHCQLLLGCQQVRKVDAPKDQMDKEWDEFQKEMRQVTNVSEAIVAEDDEEGRLDRQIGEIDEQIECYRRVEVLRNKQEVIKEKLKSTMEAKSLRSTDEIDSEEEEELQDLLSGDWRAKGALS
ncbi:Zinc finger protein 830 [Acipenser ruthenus]|uniref:Zinc finger protein 830 n=1 Tax=Acipenser ruthenus TaxID=7906 RepID=A0A444TWI6_ACIRT|nr:Zinc finger protein 830 [Acipenser ruthenus]